MTDAAPLTDEAIRAEVRRLALEGYDRDDEVVATAIEILCDERSDGAEVAERVRALAPAVFAAVAEEEATWPIPTDCDRLDRAFATLEANGVVARQDFTCCQTCGHAEIGDEIDAAERPVHGYTFFHQQDTEGAVEGGGLFLAYGAVTQKGTTDAEADRAAVALGHEIVAALRAEGLGAEWNGDLGKRIHVPLEWRRRRRR